ncbi:unnamed protein product [Enterobius vermicularis]|uniref:Tyrosine-protein phosphatase domain-containing protein n=1 Tax=Enterobius vermicularis TaxID=51028 RepID=A0A0N4VFH8_ENTVE|nr:unnamed protein product [Enterobius vermicularis]
MNKTLDKFLKSQKKLTEKEYNDQFTKIRTEQDKRLRSNALCKVGKEERYIKKNRYRDILPFDNNRVRLRQQSKSNGDAVTEEDDGDYINASPIQYDNTNTKYIAAQAPLKETLDDWFHMIQQENVGVIVCLCKLVESNKVKCERYWPESSKKEEKFGETTATLVEEKKDEEFTRRDLELCYPDGSMEKVVQLHYTEWPDHGCPSSEGPILKLIRTISEIRDESSKKTVAVERALSSQQMLHESLLADRSGFFFFDSTTYGRKFFCGDILVKEKKLKELRLDVIVSKLRGKRVSMIQTLDQYRFLYKLVAHFCQEKVQITGTNEENKRPGDSFESKGKKEGSCIEESGDDKNNMKGTIPEYPDEVLEEPVAADKDLE